jgi:glyoxylase-like metal-dependent hydrolase (beta-lactamase superfamily II)
MPDQLTITALPVGSYQANCYLLAAPESNRCIVIDPGAEAPAILERIGQREVTAILLTHGHHDHIGAVEAVRKATGARVYLHPADADLVGRLKLDESLSNGATIMLDRHTLCVHHAPGHTAGQVCFVLDDGRAIVGDTIFEGGPGKTWSAEGFQMTLQTLRNVVLPWPDETVCYPGHGTPYRLGDIRPQVKAFLARQHPAKFYGDATWEG